MQPHVNMGIRVRGCRIVSRFGTGSIEGKGIVKGTEMIILKMLSNVGMTIEKIPFWKKLYRQGKRG